MKYPFRLIIVFVFSYGLTLFSFAQGSNGVDSGPGGGGVWKKDMTYENKKQNVQTENTWERPFSQYLGYFSDFSGHIYRVMQFGPSRHTVIVEKYEGGAWANIATVDLDDQFSGSSYYVAKAGINASGTIFLWTNNGDREDVNNASIITISEDEIVRTDVEAFYAESIYDITVDEKGYLWIGTDEGAVISDGTKPLRTLDEPFLLDNDVFSFSTTGDGKMWMATLGGGFAHFDWRKSEFYDSDNTPFSSDRAGIVTSDAQGRVLGFVGGLLVTNELGYYDGEKWTVWKTEVIHSEEGRGTPFFNEIAIDAAGNLWASFFYGGVISGDERPYLVRYDGTAWSLMDLPGTGEQGIIRSIFPAAENEVWVTVEDGEDKEWVSYRYIYE